MTASTAVVWSAVLLAGVGTYLLRASFLLLFERLGEVPPAVETALEMVPAAVRAALVVPAILAPAGAIALVGNDRLFAGVAATAVAWYTENIVATILVGLVGVVLLGLG